MNAIILAAGMGKRLVPLTNNKPKSLVEVLGEPIIERQIKFLKEKKIHNITIVTGYLSDQFEYLKDKYSVNLIYNDKYDKYNNLYTMYLVSNLLNNTYILEADVYMVNNYIDENIKKSSIFVGKKNNFNKEWKVNFDKNNKIKSIIVEGGSGYIHSGITYWSETESSIIKSEIYKKVKSNNIEDEYWEDAIIPIVSHMDIYVKKINSEDWFEIDCIQDLDYAECKLLTNTID